jgi:uncharacterized SAM-dependent methyltransferase
VARQAALRELDPARCHPFVCDLASSADPIPELNSQLPADETRLVTFFGMIPNFEPRQILARLAGLLRPTDLLLFSANLAPGSDYSAGMRRILPLYDNELTRDWLMTFLLDLGVKADDGDLRFSVEDDPAGSGLKRVVAGFHFARARRLQVDVESFEFPAGETIRLFFSYRHTPKRVPDLLRQHGIDVLQQWVTKSDEEGVFLCHPAPAA